MKIKGIRVIQHNAYGDATFTSDPDNISSIIDHMLRVTTKITEHYAGDILVHIRKLEEALKGERADGPYAELLAFREMGVNGYDARLDENGAPCISTETISEPLQGMHQLWMVSYNPDEPRTTRVKFERVDLLYQA